MSVDWTTAADVRARVRRRWDDGSLLRAFARGEACPVIDIVVRGPRPSEIGDDLGAVQSWVAGLEAGRRRDEHYGLIRTPVGGRTIGRNELPTRAVVTSFDQAWALLGVDREVQSYSQMLALAAVESAVHGWVVEQPMRALSLADEWPALLAAYRWLNAERGSGRHLREITAPGVDTKFVERHRATLARLLSVPSSSTGFIAALGLRVKPDTARLRADPALGVAAGFSDVTVRVDELAERDVRARTAVILENEVTFLSVPVPAEGVVLWGKGFEVDRPGALPWLRDADVDYWGDLDTHGFAILNRLRAWLPQTRSFLMDRDTLLEHRRRWVTEATPTAARLDRLTTDEAAVYEDLVTDRYGRNVRLEQERVDWAWARARFRYDPRPAGSRT